MAPHPGTALSTTSLTRVCHTMRTSRNFIDTQDLGPDVIRAQMDLIRLLKRADKQNACPACWKALRWA